MGKCRSAWSRQRWERFRVGLPWAVPLMERLAICPNTLQLTHKLNWGNQMHTAKLENRYLMIQERSTIHCNEVSKAGLGCLENVHRIGSVG